MAEALLTLSDIVVQHDETTVLEVPRLDIFAGETLALIGPNGAGKSTLLRVIGLLQPPSAGAIDFCGKRANGANALAMRRRMASVLQEPLLLNASVYDNAALGLKIRRLDRAEIRRRVHPGLERLGIAHLAERHARTLSGGELQRTSLARALALDPELLLLDEPFSALDPSTRETLLVDLRDILRQTGITAVFVTHDRDEAFMLGMRVGVLSRGKLLQLGAGAEVFTRPVDEKVAEIVGAETGIRGVVASRRGRMVLVRFDGGAAEALGDFPPGTPVVLCLRPEDIRLSRESGACGAELNRLAVTVVKIIPSTQHYRLILESRAGPLSALVPRIAFETLDVREGEALSASFDTAALHIIAAAKQ
ncbi:MAG TPA: ABC transporter ATP-binding protein [Candidatus Binatia bacterium]|jgi:tungstate transport system ATP-binding protein